MPTFLERMKASTTTTPVKLAIEFTLLTACRTSEVLEAEWTEFDLKAQTWSIPGPRMKMDEPHRIPLSDRCGAILEEMKPITNGRKFVFASPAKDEPFSNAAMLRAAQRMEGYEQITLHGTARASFKTWAHEKTKYDSLVIEAALAHKVSGIERHYLRTTFLDERRKLMQDWARFVTNTPAAKVVAISSRS
jgi:integrase